MLALGRHKSILIHMRHVSSYQPFNFLNFEFSKLNCLTNLTFHQLLFFLQKFSPNFCLSSSFSSFLFYTNLVFTLTFLFRRFQGTPLRMHSTGESFQFILNLLSSFLLRCTSWIPLVFRLVSRIFSSVSFSKRITGDLTFQALYLLTLQSFIREMNFSLRQIVLLGQLGFYTVGCC